MNAYAATGAALPTTDPSSGLFPDEASLVQALQSYAHDSFRAVEQPFRTRPLVLAVLDSQTDRFTDAVLSFLHELCRAEHFGGWRVHSVERWFHGVPEQNADGWSLTGRIDTVLIGPEGKAAIIDYKSHRLPTVKASSVQADGTLADFQMAVYVLLWKLSDENQGHGLPVRADFWSIRNAAMHQIIGENAGRSGTVSADAYEPTLHALIGYADEFSRRLRSLRIDPTTETVRLPEACMRCPLRPVCRTTYTVSRIRLTGEGGNREHA
ncbi:MAG: PD-(D/E)XK nuclease family protein, partial [Treponema sp.]|nr:PD-(D/E)XK nuclease family protein [Treponema sp.]